MGAVDESQCLDGDPWCGYGRNPLCLTCVTRRRTELGSEDRVSDLAAELAVVEAHLGRSDTKAALLLGLAGAGMTAGPAVIAAVHPPVAASVAAWLAVAGCAAATAMLAVAVRPALAGSHGFVSYARLDPVTVPDAVTAARGAYLLSNRLVALSWLAHTKYARIRRAVDLLLGSVGAAVVAGLVSVLCGWL